MIDLRSDDADLVGQAADGDIRVAFEQNLVELPLDAIVALKTLRAGFRESRKYAQIVSSIRAIGLVEAPVVLPDQHNAGQYLLLDGHLRLEVLRDLGVETVECLVGTDEDTYTYNKRINRLPPVQEHRMIVRAVERGVAAGAIAEALGLDEASIRRRFRLLDGICEEAVELLKDANCPMKVFDIMRKMASTRQIEAADLMIGQNNFSVMFARALLAATPEDQLVVQRRKVRGSDQTGPTSQQMARMERELATLQTQIKLVEDTYGLDNLHLTVARGFIAKLLGNARVVRWLANNREEYLAEFQRIAEIEVLAAVAPMSEATN